MPEVSTKRERLELPRIMINTVGMRTIISNFKEIAEAFEESINTVKSRYRRTLSNLKKNIKED